MQDKRKPKQTQGTDMKSLLEDFKHSMEHLENITSFIE